MAKKVFGNVSLVGILALLLIIAFALLWKRNSTLSNVEGLSTMYEPKFLPPPKEFIRSGVSMSGGPSFGGMGGPSMGRGLGGPVPGIHITDVSESCKVSSPGTTIVVWEHMYGKLKACVSIPFLQTGDRNPNQEQLQWLKRAGYSPLRESNRGPSMGGGMGGPSMGGGMGGPSMKSMGGPSFGDRRGGPSFGDRRGGPSFGDRRGGPSMGGMAGSSMMIYPSTIPAGITLVKPMESCRVPSPGSSTVMWKLPSLGLNACVSVPFTADGSGNPNQEQLEWLKRRGYPLSGGGMGGPSFGGRGGPSFGGGMGGPSLGGMSGPSNECMQLRQMKADLSNQHTNISKQLSEVYKKQKNYQC
uniref:Uncharacterized protein n=1 Tax=viral metagenome TaxID=1070528 RepID=A0A6C0DN10_9ZZZZ